jgi:hypothetical protein
MSKKDTLIKNKFNNFNVNNKYKFDIKTILESNNTDNDIYNKILQKFKQSEKNYDKKNNDKILNNKKFFCSLVYYYPSEKIKDLNIEYNKNFTYYLDIKIEDIPKFQCNKLIEFILNKSNNDERKSYFIKDTKMEEYLKDNFNDCLKYNIYLLKVYCVETLVELLRNKYINYNDAIYNTLQYYFNNLKINDNMSNTNIIENLYFIIKFYETYNDFKWIKSQGEFICLVSLLLFLNSIIQINKKDIHNPLSKRNLEIDFYLSDKQLAIEIDGKQHKSDKNTIKNDTIKNILLESNNIILIRCEWNNDITNFIDKLYNNLNSFHLKKFNTPLNISKEKYFNIINEISNKIKFPSFAYILNIDLRLPDNFKEKINKDIIDKHNINMYVDNVNTNNIIKYNQIIENKDN